MVMTAEQDKCDHIRKKLLLKYNPKKISFWRIRGEDSNCDMGGHHHMPELCVVNCSYREAVEIALNMSGFWHWGAGGDIEEVLVLKPDELKKRQELEAQLRALEKEASDLRKLLGKA